MQPPVKEIMPMFQGQEHDIYCPDGRTVRVRETNGNDDQILSNLTNFETGDSFYDFLASITVFDSYLNRKPTVADIYEWPVNTMNYVLFKQRILNHGKDLEFDRTCINPKCKQHNKFEVDLVADHDGDLKNPEYQSDNVRDRISSYPEGQKTLIEFKTSSGKKLRFKILTGALEKKTLEAAPNDAHQNTKLLMRELEIENAGTWVLVTTFHGFSSREMSEIRAQVNKYDTNFNPVLVCTCSKCQTPEGVILFSISNFYFPVPKI